MKNRRRRVTTLGNSVQPALFDHDLFRHLYVARDGEDVIDLTGGGVLGTDRQGALDAKKRQVDKLLKEHYSSREYQIEHATNQAFLHLKVHHPAAAGERRTVPAPSTSTSILKEIESREPHIWFMTQDNDEEPPYGFNFETSEELFSFLKARKMKLPGRRQRSSVPKATSVSGGEAKNTNANPANALLEEEEEAPPLTRWVDIQTKGDSRIVHEVLSRFPIDSVTEDHCLYLVEQDLINTTHTSLGSGKGYFFLNLMCTPTVTAQTLPLCHFTVSSSSRTGGLGGDAAAGAETDWNASTDHVSHDNLCRGKSVMEMRFNAVRNNISRRAVPDPVPVAMIAFPGWVLTIHEKPFAEMDDLFRMLQVYCSKAERDFASMSWSFNVMTNQRFTTALFVVSFLRIAVGHNIDSVALAEAVDELSEVVFDVPATQKEQERVIRRITDIRRCFGECGTDVSRREHIIDTVLDTELENNFLIRDPVLKNVLEALQSHLRHAQHELADYRDTVAVSHWYHNVAVQRTILIRGNSDLRMILLLTEMCNIMYPVMLLQTLYSINVVVPFDSSNNNSVLPFLVTAAFFSLYLFWFGRAVVKVFRKKVFNSQFVE